MVNMGELFAHRRIGDLTMDRVPLSKTEAERFLLDDGDILFARQSLTLKGAGQVSIVRPASEPRTFESHLIRCKIDPKISSSNFWFHFFLSSKGEQAVSSIVEQVAAAGIRGADLARLPVTVPKGKLQQFFGESVNPFEDRISSNLATSRLIAQLRDTLLPKLLSGQLRIPEAEQQVADMP